MQRRIGNRIETRRTSLSELQRRNRDSGKSVGTGSDVMEVRHVFESTSGQRMFGEDQVHQQPHPERHRRFEGIHSSF